MFSYYYGYWEYWELYHKVTFDGENKLILINPGEYTVAVKRDIYSAWKEWILLNDLVNAQYSQAFSVVGGEAISVTENLDATFFLINGWKLKPANGSYSLTITGNLFTDDSSTLLVAADPQSNGDPNNILFSLQTSTVVRSVTSTSSGSNYVTASLIDEQATELTTIGSTTSDNYNLLVSQSVILSSLQTKIEDLYKIHGLKIGFPVYVTATGRSVLGDTLEQDITTVGTGVTQTTTVNRTA